MTERECYVGLDVHKDSITMAVAEAGREDPRVVATIPNTTLALLKQLRRLGALKSLRCCYEAGPTGYGIYRCLREAGVACEVIAPSLVPVKAGDRVKTDSRDARKLARSHRAGELTPIHVPDETTEAMRDLERARDDAKKAEKAVRNQLGKFLLRYDRKYEGKTPWTKTHLDWIRQQSFEHEAQNRVLQDYLRAAEDASERVARVTADIEELVESWSWAPMVKALQALRGVRLLTAVILVAELGDLRRFGTAGELMSFLGLVPSENSTGNRKRRGGITRTGNSHARWVLVEAAWSYRFAPRMSREIRRRNQGVSEEVQRIAWKAQRRLNGRYRRLLGRGKQVQRVITAVARELAGFVWAIGQQPKLVADLQATRVHSRKRAAGSDS